MQKSVDSIEDEKETFIVQIDQLENEKTALQKEVDELEKTASIAATTTTTQSEAAKVSSNSTSSSSAPDTSQSTGECDIKGSVNGIYHVPGSRYYNQTKNVVQWFCSTGETEGAGYRAPK
ncbi:hypothetical protein CWR48_03120 [Oceanobacillus arenosus]|uniref:Uncharacterized protein n=1 Tax=Oceanobacillus arenosus TaxID=1229153 RepID=A0A3D8Q1Y0_9BACI|nr:hypothetical protein [Oceanobacillus arenosus]RDW21409.1 hypothetical protein CWR48_03120 [Oceanobacillus arenosus]